MIIPEMTKAIQDQHKCSREVAAAISKKWVGEIIEMTKDLSKFVLPKYEGIMRNFVPIVTGKRVFEKRKKMIPFSKIATTSDEALAIVLLENSCNYWMDMFRDPDKKNKAKWSAPLYSGDGKGKNAIKYGGWTEAGLVRFKQINDQFVKPLRRTADYKAFESNFIRELVTADIKKREDKKKARKASREDFVDYEEGNGEKKNLNPAGDDLSEVSDEEELSEETAQTGISDLTNPKSIRSESTEECVLGRDEEIWKKATNVASL